MSRDDLAKEAGDEGEGQSTGTPAEGSMDVGAREPIETSGVHHWQEATITRPGLDDRGNVFFAAIEMTRMPMVTRLPISMSEGNPVSRTTSYPIQHPSPILTPRQRWSLTLRLFAPGAPRAMDWQRRLVIADNSPSLRRGG